jgi:hypothetical protein
VPPQRARSPTGTIKGILENEDHTVLRSAYAEEMAYTTEVGYVSRFVRRNCPARDESLPTCTRQMRATLRARDKSNTFKLSKERLYEEARRKTALMLGEKAGGKSGGKGAPAKGAA